MKLVDLTASAHPFIIDEETQSCIPMSKAKKMKMDCGDVGRSHDSGVMSIATKSKDPNLQKLMVEYCHVSEVFFFFLCNHLSGITLSKMHMSYACVYIYTYCICIP